MQQGLLDGGGGEDGPGSRSHGPWPGPAAETRPQVCGKVPFSCAGFTAG